MFRHRSKKIYFLRWSCILFCFTSVFTSLLYFSTKFKIFNDGQPLKFPHLQPLRDMFADLTVMKPNKSECMVASAEFSDLTELKKKIPVFLLVVVSTAPSRQDRREAIRQTWGTKCGGEVCIGYIDI